MSAQTGRNEIGSFSQDVVSASFSKKWCLTNSGWEARFEGGGDLVDTDGRESTAARVGGGLYKWARDASSDSKFAKKAFQASWVGANVMFGYEDFDLVFLRPGDCPPPDPGQNFPQCVNGGFASIETRQDQRATSYVDLHAGSMWTGTEDGVWPLAKDHIVSIEGRLAHVDKRTPNTDDQTLSFNESLSAAQASAAYTIPLASLGASAGLEVRAGYQYYFGGEQVIDSLTTVSTRFQFSSNASISARFTSGNEDFESWGVGVGLRF